MTLTPSSPSFANSRDKQQFVFRALLLSILGNYNQKSNMGTENITLVFSPYPEVTKFGQIVPGL